MLGVLYLESTGWVYAICYNDDKTPCRQTEMTMSTQVLATPPPVKIKDPDERFLKQAEEVAFDFISLRLESEQEVTKEAPYPPGKKEDEPELLRADEGQILQAEPASLPLLGKSQPADGPHYLGQPFAASGPPPPSDSLPSSRVVSLDY